MKKQTLSESNFDLWLLLGEVSHSIVLARKRELGPYDPSVRQLQILRAIQALGSEATLSQVAQKLQREVHVISRHTIIMEKDGLIRRIQDTPKSRLLRIELTDKGREMLDISKDSKILDTAWSFLSQDERKEVHEVLNRMLMQLRKQLPV